MSTKLSSATAVQEVRAASAVSELGVSKGGPQAELGARVTMNAQSATDRLLYYVKGPLDPVVAERGDVIQESTLLYVPAATDVAVEVPEGTGDQTWVYVKAGEDIARGDICLLATDASHDGVTVAGGASSASSVAGVAQHNIPNDSFGWLLVKGVGVALVDAAVVAAGAELIVGGGGDLEALASGKGIGLSLAAGGASPVSVKLDI